MSSNGAPAATTDREEAQAPAVVRRLDSAGAQTLVATVEIFEELQSVLRCCERLVEALKPPEGDPDPVAVEGIWTMALLSYGRCFVAGAAGVALSEEDLAEAQPEGAATDGVLEWHRLLLQLRDHHADPAENPRERFSVGVAQDEQTGAAGGVAITSSRQPLVDDLTVRQTGAVAYALSALVNARIEARQAEVFEELKTLTKDDLDQLERVDVDVDVAQPAPPARS